MSKGRRVVRFAFQWVLPVAVLVAVGWQFARTLTKPDFAEQFGRLQFRVPWVIASALLYLAGHCVWANFWTRLLNQQGLPTSQMAGLRAYFISQLGKYVPGKVWVILIRVGMLGDSRKTRAIVGVTATFEALTSMATGAMIGALLLPLLALDLTAFGASNLWLFAVAAVPVGLVLLNRLVVRVARRRGRDGHIPLMRYMTLLGGVLQASVGWLFLGLSFACMLEAILPVSEGWSAVTVLKLTAANAIAYVVGFIFLFMPAGAGIREGVMTRLLAPELEGSFGEGAAGAALYASLMLRIVWTSAEMLVAGMLYFGAKRPQKKTTEVEIHTVPQEISL